MSGRNGCRAFLRRTYNHIVFDVYTPVAVRATGIIKTLALIEPLPLTSGALKYDALFN
jgi:hypothetical protein